MVLRLLMIISVAFIMSCGLGNAGASTPEKPVCFDEMKMLASKLSKGLPQVRVDFYEVDGKVYFGELTFFHHGGIVPFTPEKWDYTFGSWIKLPKDKRI